MVSFWTCLCDVDPPFHSGPEFLIWKNEGMELFNGPLYQFTPAQHQLKCMSLLCWNPRRILSGTVQTQAQGELIRHAATAVPRCQGSTLLLRATC